MVSIVLKVGCIVLNMIELGSCIYGVYSLVFISICLFLKF